MPSTDIPAGSELDRLIAEKVMGWKIINNGPGCFDCIRGRYPKTGHIMAVTRWNPSSNIAHAWEVLDRLGSTHCGFISRFQIDWRAGECFCRITRHNKRRLYVGIADNIPLAICRAALLAVL